MVPNGPKISIVIPAYNEERYIARTIESIKKQNFRGSYEIIVVNNASTDKTAEVAKKHGAIVVDEPERGVCSARQAGTRAASGEIIVSTDADTIFKEDWLSNIFDSFKRDDFIVSSVGPFLYIDPPLWGKLYCKFLFGLVGIVFKISGKVFYSPASNFAFKKSVWEECGGYNTNLTQGGDEYDLLRRLKHYGGVAYLDKNTVMTSSRRLKYGLFYNLFITLGLYYFFGYLSGRITGKRIIGNSPAHRSEEISVKVSAMKFTGTLILLVMLLYIYTVAHTYIQSHDLISSFINRLP